ncbi:hypothetical protein RUND412_006080 [Rhizina undulata]
MAPKKSVSRVEVANPRATVQTSAGLEQSKVVCVEWEILSTKPVEGEWIVEWDDMYSDLSDDLRSARSEKGDYFVLQREGGRTEATTPGVPEAVPVDNNVCKEVEVIVHESTPVLKQTEPYQQAPDIEYDLPTAPLSTAKLLAFENGLQEEQEDLQGFFASRPIVQAPTHIIPDENKKADAYFLLASGTAVPAKIKIYFIPTWNPTGSEPQAIAEVAVSPIELGERDLHTKWAQVRMGDLKILEEIAKELEREGSRGVATGTVKVGVEGGGMDEEAVRREGWMVGEEMHWVSEKFLSTTDPSPSGAKNSETQGLGLGLGIFGGAEVKSVSVVTFEKEAYSRPSLSTAFQTAAAAVSEDEEEEDLFALPLSPRSPEMAVSPFSMFRGDPIMSGSSRPPAPWSSSIPSKLREITSIDTSSSAIKSLDDLRSPNMEVTPTNSDAHITPTMTVGMQRLGLGAGNPPPTPPQEHRGEDGLFIVGVRPGRE